MGSKLEDFTDDHRTDLMDPLPQVTQPGRNAKLWQAGTLAATRGLWLLKDVLHSYIGVSGPSLPSCPPQHCNMRTLGHILLPLAVLFLTQAAPAQAPWTWAQNAGSVSNDYSNAVCTDADGNVYITGTFQGATITFGTHVLQNTSEGFLDFFVVKYDADGNVIWAISDGGTKDDYAYGICMDQAGNVFVTGYFNSPSLAIGPSTLVNISTTINAPDAFVAKYDPNGNALWGRSGDAGPTQDYARAYGIGSDPSGNVYIAGYFGNNSSVSFDGHTIQANGGIDIFLTKYDNDGNVLWARHMGGTQTDVAQALDVDSVGNVYITGSFVDAANFGGISLVSTNTAYQEIFVAKYDTDGNSVWANYALVPYAGNYANGTGIVSDRMGDIYITGYFQYSISFGEDTLSNAGNHGLFLAKYDSNGTPLWGRSPGGTGNDFGNGVCMDASGNVILTGYFSSPFLNFGGHPVVNVNVGYHDAFVARYDPDGNALGAIGIGAAGHEYGMGVAGNTAGDLFATGYFDSYSLNFSGTVVTNAGSNDTFLAKLSSDALTNIPTIRENADVRLFPNPALDRIHVAAKGLTMFRVYDMASRMLLERQFTDMTTVDVTGMPSGLYVYELRRNGSLVKGKFIRE